MQIVYATDGSELALLGAAFLTALPLDAQSNIRLLTVAAATQTPDEAAPALDAACAALRNCPAHLTRYIREGNATEQILHETEAAPTDLVVVGMQGKSAVARFFLGSVAEWVSRHAPCSVLVARPLRHELQTVVVAIDGSKGAQAAVDFLTTFPLPTECHIHLVTVVYPEAAVQSARPTLLPNLSDKVWAISEQEKEEAAAGLAGAKARLQEAGRHRVSTSVRTGSPALTLLEEAEEAKADLLVVGARGLTDLDRFFLGSVSERLLRHAPCSVLCVRAPVSEPAQKAIPVSL